MLSEVMYEGKRYTHRNWWRLAQALTKNGCYVSMAWTKCIVSVALLWLEPRVFKGESPWDALSKAVVKLLEAGNES